MTPRAAEANVAQWEPNPPRASAEAVAARGGLEALLGVDAPLNGLVEDLFKVERGLQSLRGRLNDGAVAEVRRRGVVDITLMGSVGGGVPVVMMPTSQPGARLPDPDGHAEPSCGPSQPDGYPL